MTTRFDLLSLAGIALLALSLFEAYRSVDEKGFALSLVLPGLSLLQVLWRLRVISPWGRLNVEVWTVILAGMIGCTALGLLQLERPEPRKLVPLLLTFIALAQLLAGSGILPVL